VYAWARARGRRALPCCGCVLAGVVRCGVTRQGVCGWGAGDRGPAAHAVSSVALRGRSSRTRTRTRARDSTDSNRAPLNTSPTRRAQVQGGRGAHALHGRALLPHVRRVVSAARER
jgi:hypothetical protein